MSVIIDIIDINILPLLIMFKYILFEKISVTLGYKAVQDDLA